MEIVPFIKYTRSLSDANNVQFVFVKFITEFPTMAKWNNRMKQKLYNFAKCVVFDVSCNSAACVVFVAFALLLLEW